MNKLNVVRAIARRQKTETRVRPARARKLACVWTRDPGTNRPTCAWTEGAGGDASADRPSRLHDRGRPPSTLPLAA